MQRYSVQARYRKNGAIGAFYEGFLIVAAASPDDARERVRTRYENDGYEINVGPATVEPSMLGNANDEI